MGASIGYSLARQQLTHSLFLFPLLQQLTHSQFILFASLTAEASYSALKSSPG